jgi:hypothetical protein
MVQRAYWIVTPKFPLQPRIEILQEQIKLTIATVVSLFSLYIYSIFLIERRSGNVLPMSSL